MEEGNECQYGNVSWLVTQEKIVRNGHRSVIGMVYVLLANLLLDAPDHMSLEVVTTAAILAVCASVFPIDPYSDQWRHASHNIAVTLGQASACLPTCLFSLCVYTGSVKHTALVP